jgi:hypothetical protein
MEPMFMVAGVALFAASVIARSDGLLGAGNLVISIQLSGPAWGGAISTTLGLLLLWDWWNRRRRPQRGMAAPGREVEGAAGRPGAADGRRDDPGTGVNRHAVQDSPQQVLPGSSSSSTQVGGSRWPALQQPGIGRWCGSTYR